MKSLEPTRMLRLRPIPVERVWGGRRLARDLHRRLPPAKRIGESWEVSDLDGARSVVDAGELAGRTLREALGRPFPLLVKWIDARENLSVQVHPDARLAFELEGERNGKTEAYLILAARPRARLVLGLSERVSRRRFEDLCRTGGLRALLREVAVRAGDVVLAPAGTVHAIGGGILLLEVQEPSDTTYRLYDWGRKGRDGKPRPLHVEKGARAARLGIGRARVVARFAGGPPNRLRRLLRCAAFGIDGVRVRGSYRWSAQRGALGDRSPEVWAAVSGRGWVAIDGAEPEKIRRGDCRLVVPGRGGGRFESEEGADLTLVRIRPGPAAGRGGSGRDCACRSEVPSPVRG